MIPRLRLGARHLARFGGGHIQADDLIERFFEVALGVVDDFEHVRRRVQVARQSGFRGVFDDRVAD